MKYKLKTGDNLKILKNLPDNSIDAIITDPPYGLSFMNKKWDYEVPSVELWKEVLRVLKPGGHLLSFGGTRTYHRLVVNIEDAGFEIRDQIQWIYGSGFPKSLNIGKAVDKLEGNEREVVGFNKNRSDFSSDILKKQGSMMLNKNAPTKDLDITKGTSPYEGWGTGLKPANEPICLARKPLSEKSVAENVIKWRTGGINIDKSRIGSEIIKQIQYDRTPEHGRKYGNHSERSSNGVITQTEGRFPANIIFDEEAAEVLDEQSGITKTNCKSGIIEGKDANVFNDGENKTTGHKKKIMVGDYNDSGASRFFYVAKVSKKERNLGLENYEEKEEKIHSGFNSRDEHGNKIRKDGSIIPPLKAKNTHPTVKPINLMTYLCNLITPEGGTILDPFMGSGSTGIAALLQGYNFLGIDMDPEYTKIAEGRISNYEKYRDLLKK